MPPEKSIKNKKTVLVSSVSVIGATSLVYLHQNWYKQYQTGKFHFFNDNTEWLQMDKVGHLWTTYNTSRLMMDGFDWAGYTKKQKLIWGGLSGFLYMTAIEAFDGFSRGWGFSGGDMLGNAIGTGLAIGQEAMWSQQRLFIKYAYHESNFADYNPNLLGNTFSEKILKDYNAQIYWLSVSPFTFIKSDKNLPKWLCISFGYGATGMIRGTDDYLYFSSQSNVSYTLKFERQRQYYLSLDVDLTKIKTNSKVLKTVFTTFNTLKIPAPALQFNSRGANFFLFR